MIGDNLDGGEYSYCLHMTGQATTLPTEDEDDTIKRLHQAVEDVTGKPVEKPPKRPIGFIW